MFGIMEEAKQKFNIEDYSLSQTTLEQVFLSMMKTHFEENPFSGVGTTKRSAWNRVRQWCCPFGSHVHEKLSDELSVSSVPSVDDC